MEYVRKQEMVAKESYQAAGINYQVKGFWYIETQVNNLTHVFNCIKR
jgi:hypothetical protein